LLAEMRREVARTRRKAMVEELGYVPHPALKDGRVNNTVLPDGCKPRLYVRRNSKAFDISLPTEVASAYTAAQMA